jgi:hypothetical protein
VNAIDPDGRFVFILPAIPTIAQGLVYAATLVTTAYYGTKAINDAKRIMGNSRTDEARSTMPEYNHQRQKEREAKAELDANQAKVTESMEQNIGSPKPDGSSDPKRDPNEKWGIIGKTIGGTAIGVGIGLQVTNPDPSKEAYDSHLEEVKQQKQEQLQETKEVKEETKQAKSWWQLF